MVGFRLLLRLAAGAGSVFEGGLVGVGVDLDCIFIQLIVGSILLPDFGGAVSVELDFEGGHFVTNFANFVGVLAEELSAHLPTSAFHS